VAIGGYGMAAKRPWPLHGLHWLEWGQGLFWLSVLIWIIVLIPTQRRLIAASEAGRSAGALPPSSRVFPNGGRCGAEWPRSSRSSSFS